MHNHIAFTVVGDRGKGDEEAQRKLFHAAFADWLSQASESDCNLLEQARERVAPGQVCSMHSLVLRCSAQPDQATLLPESLTALLRERNWQPHGADAASV
ncbi:hypothetical protein NU688_33165 [Variovorax sp. ZS18.2.2]|uniref:hypothetical protein n=1 Tax=Variovorax sp. ZS18.2.2 TaxID=2971255 RepID=UPI0021514B77|nr:hypothetical protein [Variovorax sp. ZS18.2.2]MCR6481049.1 hypothetical protein [Variovorax sp. ZS18.2.2]